MLLQSYLHIIYAFSYLLYFYLWGLAMKTGELCELLLGWDCWVENKTWAAEKHLSEQFYKLILTLSYLRNCIVHADCYESGLTVSEFTKLPSYLGSIKKCREGDIVLLYGNIQILLLSFFIKISNEVCKKWFGSAQSCVMKQQCPLENEKQKQE